MENILAKVLPQEGGLEGTTSGAYNAVIGLFGLLTLIGIAFGIHALYIGHDHAYGCTREIPWGHSRQAKEIAVQLYEILQYVTRVCRSRPAPAS